MAKTRAQREADFRAAHGMSSGTWYSMRRKAKAAGIAPAEFDKVKGNKPEYDKLKTVIAAKRAAGKTKAAGRPTDQEVDDIRDAIDDLDLDIDVGWGTP